MTQWQPNGDPRRRPATPPQWQPQDPPRDPWADSAPAGYGQPQFYARPQQPPPGYWQQPPVQVNVVQQNRRGPVVVTRPGLGGGWTLFHLCMTFATCGLWIPVWIMHASSARRARVYR